MNGLSLSRGENLLTLDELKEIPIPPQTETYQPISHFQLANSLKTISCDLLHGYTLRDEKYGVARNGSQLFGVITFNAEHNGMGMAVGFRNSLDKSMSIGMVIGSEVFVCSNLMMTGDITIMRKHTKNALLGLEDLAIATLYKAQYNFAKLVKDSEKMRMHGIEDEQAFKLIGLLYGKDIISPRQIPVIKDNWLKPPHSEFQPRNMFSFYNSCTEAMKSSPPMLVMERYANLHQTLTGVIDV